MDFVADQLADGKRFRSLTVVDIYTRECLAIESEQRLKGEDVVLALNRIKIQRGVPKFVSCDNGSEFSSQAMDLWAYRNGVRMAFSRPGKPTDNAFVESFNGTFRAECLNAHWFRSWRLGVLNTTRVALTGLSGRRRPTKLPRKSRLGDFLGLQTAENSP
jgi:putative transposase